MDLVPPQFVNPACPVLQCRCAGLVVVLDRILRTNLEFYLAREQLLPDRGLFPIPGPGTEDNQGGKSRIGFSTLARSQRADDILFQGLHESSLDTVSVRLCLLKGKSNSGWRDSGWGGAGEKTGPITNKGIAPGFFLCSSKMSNLGSP